MTVFTDAADVLFAHPDLGVSATYTPLTGAASAIRVIIERAVEVIGEWGQVVERRIVINVRRADVAAPQRGDTIVAGTETWTVEKVLSDDGLEVRVVVHE